MRLNSTPERRAQWLFSWRVLALGAAFFGVSLLWPGVMSPEIYGILAYDVPAEAWALGFMSASSLVIYGVHINGRAPLISPLLRIGGLAGQLFLFSYLVFSALDAPFGVVIVAAVPVFMMSEIIDYLCLNIRLLRRRLRERKHGPD